MLQARCSSFYWKYLIAILTRVSCSEGPNRDSLVHCFCEVVSSRVLHLVFPFITVENEKHE